MVSRHLDHIVRVTVAVVFIILVVLTLVFFLGEAPVITVSVVVLLVLVGLVARRNQRPKITEHH